MNDPIKQAIFDELNILLKEPGPKNEQRLQQLKFTENYGIYLTELIIDESLDPGLRQLAGVVLKKYIDDHWNSNEEVLASDHVKMLIKSMLPKCLYCTNSKIRKSVAYAISAIASQDDWIELFDIIVACLAGNEDSVDGAMQVLVEYTYELEEKVKNVGPIILSEIYRIYQSEAYSNKTRTLAISILNSILKCANMHIDPKDQPAFFNSLLPAYMEKMVTGLSIPNGTLSSFHLKTEILRVFTYMICEMPKFIKPYMQTLLPIIWSLLTQMADIYINMIVNEGEIDPFDGNEEEKDNFIKMILQIFELIHSLAENKKFKGSIKGVISDLVYVLILYMQMTEEQMQIWNDDIEQLIDDEDRDVGVDFSIRSSGKDILLRLGEEFEGAFLTGFTEAVTKLVALSDSERNNGKPNWWKIHEATMFTIEDSDFKALALTNDTFNLNEYLNLVKGLMAYQFSPYLLGRCALTLAKYIETPACTSHITDTLNTITASFGAGDKPMASKLYAIRAIYEICVNLKDVKNEKRNFVASKLEIFLEGILQSLPESQSSFMGQCLESLSELLAFDTTFAASTAPRVIPLIQALFLKYHDDRFILEHILDILKIWSQNPYCQDSLQEKIVPTLIKILNYEGEQTNVPMQDNALDILETIVKYSKPPLSAQLIEQAFPAAINAILRTEDNSVLQSGGECLRAFLYVAPEQVCTFQQGKGLSSILDVLTVLLNPTSTESSATFVGRLVITLITKAGNFLGDKIDLLLKAALSKMQLVESLHVIMSLIMIFAHLFLIQIDAVMNFLSCIPGPSGEPAMNFVFSNWLSRQHAFFGIYERKVSVMALCKIFEYGINTQDQRLVSVMIKEVVDAPTANIKARTRSQAASNRQVVNIPIMVKIFKLLINELSNLREVKAAADNTIGSDDENESGDEDNSLHFDENGKNFTAHLLYDDDETTEDDQLLQDLMQDPIFQEDTEVSLTKFLTNFSRNDNFMAFVDQLTAPEKKILENLNIEN